MHLQIFSDRVEISNPGGLTSGLSKESFGHKSVTRNPLIADLLHRIGYIEKIGPGIKRIKDAIAETTNCSVEFKIDEHWFSTIFYRNKSNNISSDIRSNQIIELLLQDGSLSAAKITAILNISSRSVEKYLAKLKQDSIIIRQGTKKYGTWLVNTQKALKDE